MITYDLMRRSMNNMIWILSKHISTAGKIQCIQKIKFPFDDLKIEKKKIEYQSY